MLGRFFREGKVRPGFFFPRGKIYTGILFPGAILSRGGFSGGKFYARGNSMLQHRETVRIKHIDRQSKWHSSKTVSSRCLGFYVKIVCKGTMNGHFQRLFSEITSVCRMISLFLVFSRCNKDTLIYRTDIYPGIHFRLKVIPPLMKIRSFLCKCFNRISIKTRLRTRLNWVVSHQ